MNNNTDQLFSQITATQADITRSISLLAAMVSGLTDKFERFQQKESEDHYAKEAEAEVNP